MATLVANRTMDVNGLAAAARTHTQAVTRNYISQPRLSMSCVHSLRWKMPHLSECKVSVIWL
uniref:Uncharacterized protein n=1 Tax=Mola mola TaxID=94237 RepID=A0A3Q3WBC2_MOLML